MSIRINGLNKKYGTQKVLNEVSFEVKPGEVLGFLGPNGAGKSTTLKIITGLIRPDQGDVTVCGMSVNTNPLACRQKIGFLAEHNPLYLDMYIPEFLRFMGKLQGMKSQVLEKKIKEIIEITSLSPEAHKKIGTLSKGYRQRVGIAQALLHDPEVIILDEPTSGLDPNQLIGIRELIRELGRTKTLIFSSHILPEVQAIADQVVIIHLGNIVANQPLSQLEKADTQQWIEVEFELPGFEIAPVCQLYPDLQYVQESTTRWRFLSPADQDIRKIIYAESIRQSLPILSLNRQENNLEDLFRSLTKTHTNN